MFQTRGLNLETGEWNDSFLGNYLWGNTNIGETMSDILTPFTWSMVGATFEQMNILPGHPVTGNIGGRAYFNISVMATAMRTLGRKMDDLNKEMGGVRDEFKGNLPKIIIPLPKPPIFPLLRRMLQIRKNQLAGVKKIPRFLAENQDWCQTMRLRIPQITNKRKLAALLRDEITPYSMDTFWMVMGSAWDYGELTGKLRRDLTEQIGFDDTDKLLSNVSKETELLASLGPALGLARVKLGEMSREDFLEQWGHRGPHESEVSIPRPAEDPDWLEMQLATLEHAPTDAKALLTRRNVEFEKTWKRFQEQYPHKAKRTWQRLEKTAKAARVREAVRSELVRIIWVGRDWGLRAGELTDLGDDIFFLTTEEAADYLDGQDSLKEHIPARKEMYERYKALPSYPVIIRGRFDPFKWAADPNKRTDFFDPEGVLIDLVEKANQKDPSRAYIILGAPGSAGLADGIVRRLDNPEEGNLLQPGEILVTTQTNIGWSHLFPLVKAVVTDVGAALSHAAIVAREMGIPAVVNCGDASTRLNTGDRVRVDGGQGVVEIIERAT